jgi:segregation and condensation protein A
LQTLEARQADVFARVPGKIEFEEERPAMRAEVSIFDLVNAVNAILKRVNKREDLRDIFEDKWTVSEKIEHLMKSIRERSALKFSDLFAGVTTRTEVVVTFLALLELIRLKQLTAVQREPFGEIEICQPPPPVQAAQQTSPTEPAATPADSGSESSSLAT